MCYYNSYLKSNDKLETNDSCYSQKDCSSKLYTFQNKILNAMFDVLSRNSNTSESLNEIRKIE